ncbi:PapD-like protein [Absidia repens]|uniref:PapD-like protein n=1 Tax=Absidia repens TaxID=90262 RepID=A0A1X2I6M5_9FUNG|nr:PapD-like protein [Absidia repens]
MSVVLDPPNQLVFKRPLTQPIEEFLYVKNVGTEPIAFKVKTTAPKQYCVRPNSGIISPSSHVEVQVIFQPFKEEPAPDFKCKDKFLVQTAEVKLEWTEWSMVELWNRIETEHRESMSQRKVKCVFLAPELPQPHQQSLVKNEEPTNEPLTPTSSHDRSIVGSIHSNRVEGDDDDDENDSSPTLASTLPAIIDAANRSSSTQNNNNNSNKSYDPSASSVSLLTAHTTMATTPKPSSSSTPPPQQQQQQQQQQVNTHSAPLMATTTKTGTATAPATAPTTTTTTTTPIVDPKVHQQLKDENDTLQRDLNSARTQQTTLEQQLANKHTELKTAQSLTERLQQQIKTLEQENQKLASAAPSIPLPPSSKPTTGAPTAAAAAAAAHAMQSSPLPVDGYPPQVLLSVSALVFIFTYLFF